MADNKDKKVLKSSIEREQSQTCLNSAEREKIKGSTNLNVPHLRFPEFRGEWEEHTLSEYLEFKNGLNPDAKRIGNGLPFISVMDILSEGVIRYDNIRGKVDATEKEIECFGVKNGDILFQRSSETLEDVGRANVYMDDRTAIYGGFVIRGRKIGNYDPMFFKFLLATPLARKSTCRMGAGAQHFNIGQEGLSKILLFFPHIEEQRKIASLLSLIDQRIATQNKIIEKLQSLIKGIYDKILWQGYKQTSLSGILDERNERTTINNQYQVLSSTAKGLYRQSDYFDKEVASVNNIGYKVLRLGDIVLSPQNLWLGNINYNDAFEIGIVSPSYKVFSIKEDYNPYFVSCFLKTPKALYEYANASEQGASIVRRNLDINAFMAICFPMPDRIMQDKVSERLRAINMKFDIEKQILEKLNIEKQYLLRQMFI